jgi:hypothetical protein
VAFLDMRPNDIHMQERLFDEFLHALREHKSVSECDPAQGGGEGARIDLPAKSGTGGTGS